MKKILLTLSLIVMAIAFTAVNADAITGECSNCHTMHDRQGAVADIGDAGAQEQLLTKGCISCHSGTHDGDGKFEGAPVVLDTDADPVTQGVGVTNAGGDFYWVVNAAVDKDAKGHNVVGVSAADGTLGTTPPGWDYAATSGDAFPVTAGTGTWGSQLTCAGTYGCHGSRENADPLDAISGSHHNNDNTAGNGVLATKADTANTIANSYRFLLGIKGLENEFANFKPGSHNEYFGADNTDAERDDEPAPGSNTYLNRDTMSSFCAQCHGLFHSRIVANGTLVQSPWVRHPTDIVFPTDVPATEYELYNTTDGAAKGDYSLEAPVARGVVPNASSDIVTFDASATGAIVMCLSCHRAHGSPENDMLRWTYSDMTVNGANTGGCFTCHTTKNAATAHP